MSSVEFAVKLRDGAQMIVDACVEYLEAMGPPRRSKHDWDPNQIKWEHDPAPDNPKGSFEKTSDVNNPEFKAMVQDLNTHNKFTRRDGYQYWLYQSDAQVGRRKLKSTSKKPEEKQETSQGNNMTEIQQKFPSELRELLSFTQKEGYYIIKPHQFLGSDNFAKIAAIVRGAGGEYISAGKGSYFRVPR